MWDEGDVCVRLCRMNEVGSRMWHGDMRGRWRDGAMS